MVVRLQPRQGLSPSFREFWWKKMKKNLTFCGPQTAEISSPAVYIKGLRVEKCKRRMLMGEALPEAFSGETTTTTQLEK